MPGKILLAADKPFVKEATEQMREAIESRGLEFEAFQGYKGGESDLVARVRGFNGLIIRSDIVSRAVIDAGLPDLKLIIRAGSGYDNIDYRYARAKGIIVENTPGMNSNAVAELAIDMMHEGLRPMDGNQGGELRGKTLAIDGFGNVGRLVALLGIAYGMDVVAYDTAFTDNPKYRERATDIKVRVADSVEQLYKGADIVTLHIPAPENPADAIGARLLLEMNPKGIIVNTARAAVINLLELEQVLKERPSMKYMTDVAPTKKLDGDQAVAIFERIKAAYPGRVFATPKKMGAETLEANVAAGVAAAKQAAAYFADDRIENCVWAYLPRELSLYGPLAERLGQLAAAFEPAPSLVQITCYSDLEKYRDAIQEYVIRGIFMKALGKGKTLDDAAAHAKAVGVTVKHMAADNTKGLGRAIAIDVQDGGKMHSLRGRVEEGRIYASTVDDFTPNMPLEEGVWVFAAYDEEAGMASKVGDPLVAAGYNRVFFGGSQGRDKQTACAYFNPDRAGIPRDEQLKEIERISASINHPKIKYVKVVELR